MRPSEKMRRRTSVSSRRSLTAALSAAAMLCAGAQFAHAINITLNYQAASSTPPASDPGGAQLQAIMAYVRDYYNDVFEDAHNITINYRWGTQPAGTLAAHTLNSQGGTPNRETQGTIVFSNTVGWFYDATPADNSEFNMTQTLWRDLSAAQRTNFFNAGANIPQTYEAGFTGTNNNSNPNVAGNTDLLSVALHEVGHALGMSGANTATQNQTADGDYDFNTAFVFGRTLAARTSSATNIAHLADSFAIMFPSIGTGVRRLPSHTDLFSMASGHAYTLLDVPRREFYGGTDWNTPGNWSGNQIPGSADEAFVRASGPAGEIRAATLSANASVGTLNVMEGSDVSSGAFQLNVFNALLVDGFNSDIIAASGGTVNVLGTITLQNQGEMFMSGGRVNAQTLNNFRTADGIRGNGTVSVSGTLRNDGAIIAQSGTLTIAATGSGTINLDGNFDISTFSEPGIVTVTSAGAHLVVNGPLSDGFNGGMTIGNSNTVTMSNPWTIAGQSGTIIFGSTGVLNLNGGTTAATASQLNGATVTVTGIINVGTNSYGTMNANAIFEAPASVNIRTGGVLDLENSSYTFAGGSYFGAGTIKFDGNTTILADTTFNVDNIDFDGDSIFSDVFTVNSGVTATFNGTVTDAFDDNLVINGTLVMNSNWTNQFNTTLNTGTLAGTGTFVNAASLTVSAGTSRINQVSRFNVTSTNTINGLLRLGADSFILGGTWTGTGSLSLDDQTTTFLSNTTLNIGFDMDGLINGNGTVIINNGVTVAANNGITDTFNATLNVNAGTFNSGAAWNNSGVVNLNGTGGTVAAITGSPFTNNAAGLVNITGGTNNPGFGDGEGGEPEGGTGGGRIATGTFVNSGTINVATNSFGAIVGNMTFNASGSVFINAGAELSLQGPTTFLGGSFSGPGTLTQDTGALVVAANTTINVATYDWDGGDVSSFSTTTVNPGVTFTINSNVIEDDPSDYDSTITVNSGTLSVNTLAPWPLAGTLNLNNTGTGSATLTGQPVLLNFGGRINTTIGATIASGVQFGLGTISVNSGAATITGPLSSGNSGVLNKAGAAQLNINGPQSHGLNAQFNILAGSVVMNTDAGAGGANLGITHGGTNLNFGSNQHLRALTINAGATAFTGIAGNGGIIATDTLTIAGGAAPTGTLNIQDDNLIIKYSGASPLAGISAQIRAGYNTGDWNGPGIRSSTAALNPNNFAVGIVEASDIGSPPTFAGEPIDSTTLLIRYTRQGDANLDRVTNIADFALLGANFNLPGRWYTGDFNYDGMTTIADFSLLAANFNLGVPAETGRGGVVPEPAALSMLGLTGLLLGRRRR